MKTFFHLLFYKMFRVAGIMREKDDAAKVASLFLGFILAFSILHVKALFSVYHALPDFVIIGFFIIIIFLTSYYFLKNGRFNQVIDDIETSRPQLIYHFMVYVFLAWSIIGAFLG